MPALTGIMLQYKILYVFKTNSSRNTEQYFTSTARCLHQQEMILEKLLVNT